MKEGNEKKSAVSIRSLGSRLLQLAVVLLVLFAAYVTAGRLLLPVLTTQKDQVETRLSLLLGTAVNIGSLQGSWFRYSPSFEVTDLSLQLDAADAASRLNVAHAELSMDLLSTMRLGELTLNHISFTQLELALQQTATGNWTLLGMTPGGKNYQNNILDLLLNTPYIEIKEASLLVRLADGGEINLQSVFVQLDNQQQQHRLSLQFRLGDQNSPALALLEMQGDPRAAFQANIWAGTDEINLQTLAPLISVDLSTDVFSASGQFWLSLDNEGVTSAKGQLANVSLLGRYGETAELMLTNAAANFSLLPENGEGPLETNAAHNWQLALHDLAFDWNNSPWELSQLNFTMSDSENTPWQLQAANVDIAMLAEIAGSLPLPEQALSALGQLAPAGNLLNVMLESDRSGLYPDLFVFKSNFTQLSVGAWNGAPAASGLNGYVETSASKGLVDVAGDDVSIYLPNLFREPWRYQHLDTRVSWSVQNGDVMVASTPINVSNELLQGRVQFSLFNDRLEDGQLLSDFTLLVGMDYMDVAAHSAYLPTMANLAPTMQWLDTALQGGRIVNSGFLLRTPAAAGTAPTSATQSSWFRVQEGRLQFLPDWPLVEITTAGIVGRDLNTDILSTGAQIGGLSVQHVSGKIRPAATGSLLTLGAKSLSSTQAGIKFLTSTPLRTYVGSTLNNWDASGMLDLNVNLQIPLGNNNSQQKIAVIAQSLNSTLHIKDYSLDINSINGQLNYHQDIGLQAKGLNAVMFSSPVKIAIASSQDTATGTRTIQVNSEGSVAAAELARWEGQTDFVSSLLGFTDGTLAYKASLDLPGAGNTAVLPRLQILADLQELNSGFPVPFQKMAGESGQIQLDLNFTPTGQNVVLRYNDSVSGQLVLDEQGINRGQVFFGKLNQSFNIRQSDAAAKGLLVNGDVKNFNYEEWQKVADRIIAETRQGGSSLKDYLRLIDVNIEHLQVAGQSFENINVQVQHKEEAWHIFGQNSLLTGNFILPDVQDEPWEVTLDYLRFPPRELPDPDAESAEEEIDLLQELDPSTLPAFNFKTAELSIGESNLGTFSFALKPLEHGAMITDFRMQEDVSSINGALEGSGATIDWSYEQGLHRSHFTGVFAAGDLAKVMPKWGHDANIVSRQALFGGELSWPGSPLAFSLKKSSGEVSMAINNGRFVNIDSGSSKLLGAFNFDALVRRLELDFSDLYGRGFSYDSIKGELTFIDGVVHTRTPLIIDGPSSRLNINGEISLPNETIAADMLVRIPLGENISMLAGLLGAWPIAVSTYLASKIFADQVEDFTTIIYRLEGTWENPQAGFEAPEE